MIWSRSSIHLSIQSILSTCLYRSTYLDTWHTVSHGHVGRGRCVRNTYGSSSISESEREKKRDKWMCGVRPHVRIGQEDFGLLLVCLGSGGLFVFVWVCVRVEEVVGGWRICNRDDDWLESGLYYKSENKGLISVDRSNKATLLLTIPRSSI